jgi:hypothetical protein
METITQVDRNALSQSIGEVDLDYERRIDELRNAANALAVPSGNSSMSSSLMNREIDLPTSIKYLGLSIGIVPTAAILGRLFVIDASPNPSVLVLAILATIVTGIVGFLTGGAVARSLDNILASGVLRSILFIPILGAAWGIVAGATGGLFLFVVGSIVGAIIGGAVAAAALPIFAAFHFLIADEGQVSVKRFLPIAAGLSGTTAAVFLGM